MPIRSPGISTPFIVFTVFFWRFFWTWRQKVICQQNFKVLALNVYQGYVRACVNVHVSTRTRMCVDVRHAKCAGVSANVAKVKRCKKKIFYKKVFTYAIVRRRQQYFFGFYTSNLAMHPWVWEQLHIVCRDKPGLPFLLCFKPVFVSLVVNHLHMDENMSRT